MPSSNSNSDNEESSSLPPKCRATIADLKDAKADGPLLDRFWRCRVCKCLAGEHNSGVSSMIPTAQAYVASPPQPPPSATTFLQRHHQQQLTGGVAQIPTTSSNSNNKLSSYSSNNHQIGDRFQFLRNVTINPPLLTEESNFSGQKDIISTPMPATNAFLKNHPNLPSSSQSLKKCAILKPGDFRINFVGLLRKKLKYKTFEAPFECDKAIRIENVNDKRDAATINEFNRLNKLRRLILTNNAIINVEGIALYFDSPASK